MVPAFKLRSPSVRIIPAIDISSFSARETAPAPEVMDTEPSTLASARLITPPLRVTAPSSMDITPLWLIPFVPAFKVRSPSVRIIPAIEIASFSVRETAPAPEVMDTEPSTLASARLIAPPSRVTAPLSMDIAPL